MAIAQTQNIRDLRHWICWRSEERKGKPSKVPYSPTTGKRASSTNPETWASYPEAVRASREGGCDGIGFVFTGEDPFCGVDLDGCLDPETGEVEGWAQEIIDELDSYTEISPSGTGVHVLMRAELPEGRKRKGRFEAYDRRRYFTVSGRHLSGTPRSIEGRQEQLESVVGRVLGEPESTNGHKEFGSEFVSSLSDQEIIEEASTADNGEKFRKLWAGDSSGYTSASEADAAICSILAFWTGPDPQRIDSLFRQSGLCREKWTGREDYRRKTVERALRDRTEFYQVPKVVRLAGGTKRAVEELQPEEVGILLSGVEPEEVEWLWPSRLALGKLALMDGDPGLGKSATSLDIAARVSAGRAFPDGTGEAREPAGVVLLSAEDGLADTIRPRLDAAGGDASRIVALATVPDENGHERLLSIPEDVSLIEKGIERVGARLVVVDPLMAFLSGETNSHRDQDVRRALAPLAGLAERTGACVLVVRHLNKAPGNNPLYRGGGSIGIIGAARMAFVVGKDPQDENRRVLASTKNNLAKLPASLLFTLEEADARGAVRVNWLGESEVSAHQILATPSEEEQSDARSEAVEFLNYVLADGPMPARDIIGDAEDAGIAEKTLRRAKKLLGVIAYREGEAGKRGAGHWLWKLPVAPLRVAEADQDGQTPVQDGHHGQEKTIGHLNPQGDTVTEESGLDKPKVQDGRNSDLDGHDDLGGQGGQDGQRLETGHLNVRTLLEDPPGWLAKQLGLCREDPDRYTNATAAAVAAELFGSAERRREVVPIIEEFVGCD